MSVSRGVIDWKALDVRSLVRDFHEISKREIEAVSVGYMLLNPQATAEESLREVKKFLEREQKALDEIYAKRFEEAEGTPLSKTLLAAFQRKAQENTDANSATAGTASSVPGPEPQQNARADYEKSMMRFWSLGLATHARLCAGMLEHLDNHFRPWDSLEGCEDINETPAFLSFVQAYRMHFTRSWKHVHAMACRVPNCGLAGHLERLALGAGRGGGRGRGGPPASQSSTGTAPTLVPARSPPPAYRG